ncbi:MAG: copper-binding protein [Alphaproteobacteria bacterium]|nr:copper-binding protein [Alphaproteobacteria bacterium]
MKLTIAAAALLALSSAAHAQNATEQVKKIDIGAGKMTVDHGPIKSLDMGPMSMVFRVANPEMLKQVKPGDRIIFDAERVNGAITITKMRKAK